ncbi:PD-(D/E)XK nuclease family protein [Evansella sp. AB-rgal1]|uniref:PDDEXK-like family protein n=1 Tax=Evansella sp. AB-rgal1 TaxID=3242696 RepID=UPI00359E199B
MENLIMNLFALTNDEDFEGLRKFHSRSNTFRVCGMSHMELWHSNFMAWLLNPNESHNLGMYPIKRYIYALINSKVEGDKKTLLKALKLLEKSEEWHTEVDTEYPIGNNQRIDVFGRYTNNEGEKIVLTIEQKVNAEISDIQFSKYEKWVKERHIKSNELENSLLIFVAAIPEKKIKREFFHGSLWFTLDYQVVLDEVLLPCLNHQDIDIYARKTLDEYIVAIGTFINNEKLAITQEEKEIVRKIKLKYGKTLTKISELFLKNKETEEWAYARSLVFKYQNEFESIKSILLNDEDVNVNWNYRGNKKRNVECLKIRINGEEIKENLLVDMLREAIKKADEIKEIDFERFIGFMPGNKAINPFFHDDHMQIRGSCFSITSILNGKQYYVESRYSNKQGMKNLEVFLNEIGFDVEYEIVYKN